MSMSNGTQNTPVDPTAEASPAQVAEMRVMIKRVRDEIAKFHHSRRQNNERAAGLRASMMHPMHVQQLTRSARNSQVEAQAVEALRQFITVLGGREPTREEMQQGIPEGYEDRLGLGMWPVALAVIAVAGATGASVYEYFHYLNNIEDGIQQRTATPLERVLQALSDNIWGVAAVGAIVLGGAIYLQSSKSVGERRKAEIEKYKAAGKALERSMKEVEKSESLTEKVASVVKNAIFPPDKNPDLSPAQRLAAQVEALGEEEQERFFDILDGEDAEDEEPKDESEEEVEDSVEENDPSDDSEKEDSEESDDEESDDEESEVEETEDSESTESESEEESEEEEEESEDKEKE